MDRCLRRAADSTATLLAFTLPLGIGVHVAAELAALGTGGFATIGSLRHLYLGCLALGWLIAAGVLIARMSSRAQLSGLLARLPYGGGGWRFFAVAGLAQFAFFTVTEVAEGAPVASGDIALAVLGAVLASMLGSLALAACKSRVIEGVYNFVTWIAHALCPAAQNSRCARRTLDPSHHRRRPAIVPTIAVRPPPFVLSIG